METARLIEANETQVIPHQQTALAAQKLANQLISISDDITATRNQISLITSQGWWSSHTSKTENIKVLAQNVLKINNCIAFQNTLIQHLFTGNALFVTEVQKVLQNVAQNGGVVSDNIKDILKILQKEIDARKETEIKFDRINQSFQLTYNKVNKIEGIHNDHTLLLREVQETICIIGQSVRDEQQLTEKRLEQINHNFQLARNKIKDIEVQNKDNASQIKKSRETISAIEQRSKDEKQLTEKRLEQINQSVQLTDHRISEIQGRSDENTLLLKKTQETICIIEQRVGDEQQLTEKRLEQINHNFQLAHNKIKDIEVQNKDNASQIKKSRETISAIEQNIVQLKARQLAFENDYNTFREHFANKEIRNLHTSMKELNEKMKQATQMQQQQKRLFIGIGVILLILNILSFFVK